jgi:hypothetical protein
MGKWWPETLPLFPARKANAPETAILPCARWDTPVTCGDFGCNESYWFNRVHPLWQCAAATERGSRAKSSTGEIGLLPEEFMPLFAAGHEGKMPRQSQAQLALHLVRIDAQHHRTYRARNVNVRSGWKTTSIPKRALSRRNTPQSQRASASVARFSRIRFI